MRKTKEQLTKKKISNYLLCLYLNSFSFVQKGHLVNMEPPNYQKVFLLWTKLNQPSWTKPKHLRLCWQKYPGVKNLSAVNIFGNLLREGKQI